MPCPQSAVKPCPARCLHRGRPPFPRLPTRIPLTPHRICPPFDPRQQASSFNQPLSFDTFSVTDMRSLFTVRSPRPKSAVKPSPARCLHRGRPPPPRLPTRQRPAYLAPHRMPFFRLSAVRVGVRSAAELRHLQRHRHAAHVLRALFPVPCPKSAVEPSPARCVRRGRPPPPASRGTPRPTPNALLSTLGSPRRRSTSR